VSALVHQVRRARLQSTPTIGARLQCAPTIGARLQCAPTIGGALTMRAYYRGRAYKSPNQEINGMNAI